MLRIGRGKEWGLLWDEFDLFWGFVDGFEEVGHHCLIALVEQS